MSSSSPTSPRADRPWWRDAVVYQVYVRSFASSGRRGGGPGVGDLPGITEHLPHVRDLGADAVWLTPFYVSPQHDHGYDVADYTDVDPMFGTLDDVETLLETAHGLGLRVIVDLVPNHTSWSHEWFQAALTAPPGSPERARYLFRDGRGPDGDEPPNNWRSTFGGDSWTRVTDGPYPGQWYLHLFDTSQPDLDWRNPEVGDAFVDILRFWLDRGVDGFRVDVAHGLVKEASLRDQERPDDGAGAGGAPTSSMVERTLADEPMWDQPEVHEIYRRWHDVLASYDSPDGPPASRMMVAEAWTQTEESMARFVRPDEMQQAFNFHWLTAPWSASSFAQVVTDTMSALAPVGASATWVLSNHDVKRHVTRYSSGELGLRRARAATLTMLALPGSAYVYQGEELGLAEVDVPPEARQDPHWLREQGRDGEVGRDGCRVPIPWSGSAPPYGFGPGEGQPWLPQPTDWADLSVQAQAGGSTTLEFYRAALAARRRLLPELGDDVGVRADGEVLTVVRGPLTVVLNCGDTAVPLPDGEVVVSSSDEPLEGWLPGATAVWLRIAPAD